MKKNEKKKKKENHDCVNYNTVQPHYNRPHYETVFSIAWHPNDYLSLQDYNSIYLTTKFF